MIKCARNCQPAVPGSFLFRVSVDVPLDAVDDHLERDQVFAALRDDKIRIFLARLILFVLFWVLVCQLVLI